jgi:Lon-like ATP-dependent protease
VRGLQKQLEKVFRKVALKIARAHAQEEELANKAKEEAAATPADATAAATVADAEIVAPAEAAAAAAPAAAAAAVPSSLTLPIVVDSNNLWEYVGKPVHNSDRMYDQNPIGVATGLGTNSMGGWLLYTECTTADQEDTLPPRAMRVPTAGAPLEKEGEKEKEANKPAARAPQPLGRGELFCTGQLGDVIRESSSIAYTVAKRLVAKYTHALSPHRSFFAQHRIHLHLPEGATPKDGPSAGIAMVTALLSLALQTPPVHAHAMTGELTLTGLVLPIGGVKEKLMAAKHANIRLVVLPAENRKDVEELKDYVIEGLDIHYASTYDDVFKLIFPHFQDVAVAVPLAEGAPVAIDSLAAKGKKKKQKRASPDQMPSPLIPGVETPSTGTQPNAQ